jgi:ribosomal protein S18 acetylase RimI-like enzyme
LLSWELWYDGAFLDRSLDKKRLQLWIDSEPDELFAKLGGYWHLGLLATDPKYQRRGIGKKLVEFGREMARKENVPVTLEASVVGRGLYLKIGFKIVNYMELSEAAGIAAVQMVWEPEDSKGNWLEDKGDGKAEIKALKLG